MHKLVFALVLFCVSVNATVSVGHLKTNDKWHFLGKFCYSNFDPTRERFDAQGTFDYTFETSSTSMYILVYLGTNNYTTGNGAWDPAYEGSKTGWSCQQLVDAHRAPGKSLVVSGRPGYFNPTQVVRAYFWYFAVADCSNSSDGLDVQYSLKYLNPGNFWWAQFSYDEQGIPQMYIAFTLFYIILLIFQVQSAVALYHLESFHPIVRLLTGTVIVQLLSVTSLLIHYLIFGSDGIGVPALKGFGDLTSFAGQVMMMFMCILVAKGWTITTNYLTDKIAILVVTCLYFISHLSLFIWDYVGRDPASTLYFYDSIPGLLVILLRLGLAGWFLWSLSKTVQLESVAEKRTFYLYFGGSYTLWFLLLPAIVAFALVLEPWYQMRTVTGMMLTADALAMLWFVILLSASRAAKYFNIKATPHLLAEQQRLAGAYGSVPSAAKEYEEL